MNESFCLDTTVLLLDGSRKRMRESSIDNIIEFEHRKKNEAQPESSRFDGSRREDQDRLVVGTG
jgi:hypothetical protein